MAKGPWYISASAVREYLRILGRPVVEDGPEFHRAEAELIAIARNTLASDRQVRKLRNGQLQYRGPAPLRLRLLVAAGPRDEGEIPQLVQVLASSPRVTRARLPKYVELERDDWPEEFEFGEVRTLLVRGRRLRVRFERFKAGNSVLLAKVLALAERPRQP